MLTKKLMMASSAAVLAFGLSACGGDMAGEDGDNEESGAEQENGGAEGGDQAAMEEPFGPACDDVPDEGAGSFDGMAEEPVATAASNNPALSTLTDAVGEADLVDTLNGAEDITVFAPADSAFEEIPEDDLNALLEDQEQLSDVLSYHAVEGQQAPQDLEEGDFTSLQGEGVTSSGSGEDFIVNDEASVVCGNVQTSNATVYIIDTVLMPGE